jgi:hypothetical protein
MALEFSGPATRLSEQAIISAAASLDCEVAAVKAVIDVESRGGFLADKRPKILFERHYFSRLTNRKHDAKAPDISSKKTGGYKGGSAEYDRLAKAIALNREAALRSASWGAFQILGDNFKVAGFGDVEAFVKAMCKSEGDHLAAFVNFVKGNHLDDELRRRDWAGFARGYNGPAFKKNKYDTKLANAFAHHAGGGARADGPRTLRMGDDGEDVEELQRALRKAGARIKVDADFGPATKEAVMAFQRKARLPVDGIVGPATRAKLGL